MAQTVILPTNEEMAWRQSEKMLMYNPLTMPNYYTTLFATFKALLDEEHVLELEWKIQNIEGWFSDDLNQMTLQEAETRMWANMDLLSGFYVRGFIITQMEINERLEKIKAWLTDLLFYYMQFIRFVYPLKID